VCEGLASRGPSLSIREPIEELERRKFDDALVPRPRGLPPRLPPTPWADSGRCFVSHEHAEDACDLAVSTADHGEPTKREGGQSQSTAAGVRDSENNSAHGLLNDGRFLRVDDADEGLFIIVAADGIATRGSALLIRALTETPAENASYVLQRRLIGLENPRFGRPRWLALSGGVATPACLRYESPSTNRSQFPV
jgi:hypothetical protein